VVKTVLAKIDGTRGVKREFSVCSVLVSPKKIHVKDLVADSMKAFFPFSFSKDRFFRDREFKNCSGLSVKIKRKE
jgi:hypothetical protein